MRRLILAVVLAVGLILPATTSGADPSLPTTGDAVYTPAVIRDATGAIVGTNACGIEFTPNLARTWWTAYFAAPVDLADVRPGLMPGALVLTPDEYTAAVALNARGNTLPNAPRDWNPFALPVTPGLVDADGVAFCPTDSAAAPIPLGVAIASVAPSRYAASITRLRTYIARLTACACNPVKLALYEARLDVYLSR